jgi:hypothetical protein
MTLVKACKNDCHGSPADIMVIQCNATNEHGYAFGNGYINVFGKSTFCVLWQNLGIS